MSDGLIQRVFEKAIDRHNALPSSQRGYDIWTSFEVVEIKNEIIAEIKKMPLYSDGSKLQLVDKELLLGTESEAVGK